MEVTRGGLITTTGQVHPCLCKRREEGPAWIADAVRRHAHHDPAAATILTTKHRPESCRLTVRSELLHESLASVPGLPPAATSGLAPDTPTRVAVAFSSGTISIADTTAAAARARTAALLRRHALMTAAHAQPPRPVLIACVPERHPPWISVDPSTPTTRLDSP